MATPTTMPAITHVALTVSDLARSEAWYTNVLGAPPVLDEDTGPFRHIVYQLGNTLLGLHGFPDLHSKDAFDERTPGLDHISFGVATRGELEEWAARLDAMSSGSCRSFSRKWPLTHPKVGDAWNRLQQHRSS